MSLLIWLARHAIRWDFAQLRLLWSIYYVWVSRGVRTHPAGGLDRQERITYEWLQGIESFITFRLLKSDNVSSNTVL